MPSISKTISDMEEVEPELTVFLQGSKLDLVVSCGFPLDPVHLLLLPQ